MSSFRARLSASLLALRHAPASVSDAQPDDPILTTADPADRAIVEQVRPYTMTSAARILAVVDAVRHCVARRVPGAFAECGVWRGGSILAMVLTLQELGIDDRDIHLYDTFEGMPEPTEVDTSPVEQPALTTWERANEAGTRAWNELFDPALFGEQQVRDLLTGTGYPVERLHFARGRVEDTLPRLAPERIALLRLDTDWYESTRHELVHLYPRLSGGGVLIVDDYGHWAGCRRAVDEYFSAESQPILLTRVDYTARIGVKP